MLQLVAILVPKCIILKTDLILGKEIIVRMIPSSRGPAVAAAVGVLDLCAGNDHGHRVVARSLPAVVTAAATLTLPGATAGIGVTTGAGVEVGACATGRLLDARTWDHVVGLSLH